MVIINSDDFGYSPQVNKAIYLAFKENLISSTSMLVNFKPGFTNAFEYVAANKINTKAIGIHLNITEGPAMTDKMKNNSRFCRNGIYKSRKAFPVLYLNSHDRSCVYEEMKSQIELFIKYFGFLPSHIDTHHHIHAEWGFSKIVIKLAKEYTICSIRLVQNTGNMAYTKRIYRDWLNRYLKQHSSKTVDKFGGIEEILSSGIDSQKNYEIMVHALLSNDGKRILDLDGDDLSLKLTKLLGQEPWSLSNYNDL